MHDLDVGGAVEIQHLSEDILGGMPTPGLTKSAPDYLVVLTPADASAGHKIAMRARKRI